MQDLVGALCGLLVIIGCSLSCGGLPKVLKIIPGAPTDHPKGLLEALGGLRKPPEGLLGVLRVYLQALGEI